MCVIIKMRSLKIRLDDVRAGIRFQEIVANLLDGLAPGVRHVSDNERECAKRHDAVQHERTGAHPQKYIRVHFYGDKIEDRRQTRDDGTGHAGHVDWEHLAEHGVRDRPQTQTIHGHVEQDARDDDHVGEQRVSGARARAQERGQREHCRGVARARDQRQLLEPGLGQQHRQQYHGAEISKPGQQRHQVAVDRHVQLVHQLDHVRR